MRKDAKGLPIHNENIAQRHNTRSYRKLARSREAQRNFTNTRPPMKSSTEASFPLSPISASQIFQNCARVPEGNWPTVNSKPLLKLN